MKNQGGFATFEVILAVIIISVLAFIAVPKIDRVIDKIALDYEMKRFCREWNFAQSESRLTFVQKTNVFAANDKIPKGGELILRINYTDGSYEITNDKKKFRDTHRLIGGIKLQRSSNSPTEIIFAGNSTSSKSYTFRFVSRHGEFVEVKIDTVGRIHGERKIE